MADEPTPNTAGAPAVPPAGVPDSAANKPGFDLEVEAGNLIDDLQGQHSKAAQPAAEALARAEWDPSDAEIRSFEKRLRESADARERDFWDSKLARALKARSKMKWALAGTVALALILILLWAFGVWDTGPPLQSQKAASAQNAAGQSQNTSNQSSGSAGASGESRTWLFSSQPEGWDTYYADWHLTFNGPLESGTISISEDKTGRGSYQASGDKLVIDLTRVVGATNPTPQTFHYEMTGYPGSTMEGIILIDRLSPEEPEWGPARPARATQ